MKKLKVILVFLIILSIMLFLFLTFGIKKVKEYTFEEYRVSIEGENPELEEALKIRVFPINKEILENYYLGDISLNYFYEKLYDFIHGNIQKLRADLINTTDLKEYLETNQNELIAICGINNIESLSVLKTLLIDLKTDDSNYINSEIIEESYVQNNNYDNFYLKINYKNGQSILFKTYIAKSFSESPLIIFEPVMEE